MADHSKDNFGGTLRLSLHSSKKHQLSTESLSTAASQRASPSRSNSRRNPSKKEAVHNRPASSAEETVVSAEPAEASSSRSLRCSRRSTSSSRQRNQESKVSATEARVAELDNKHSSHWNTETPAAQGKSRKRSFPTLKQVDFCDSSEVQLKRQRRSIDETSLIGKSNGEQSEGHPVGIKAALRSNRQAALFTGLSPFRRRSAHRLSTGSATEALPSPLEPEQSQSSLTTAAGTGPSSPTATTSAVGKGTITKAKQRKGETKRDKAKANQPVSTKAKSYTKKKRLLPSNFSTGNSDLGEAASTSSGLPQQQQQQKSQKGKRHCQPDPGVASRSKASKTTGSCASNRRRASVVVGSKQSAPAASASTNSLTVGPSSVFKQSVMSSSSGQDSDAQPSHNQQQAAEGHEASADAGATASAVPALGSFASLIQTLDQDSNDVGRLQALLESRGLPSQLFSALGPRMHQILHRSMIGGSASKAQQLLQGLQSKDEGQQLSATIEMCQLLVMGNEDTLAGFPIKQVVPALIQLLQMEHSFDIMNNACRALTYMMEALPRSSAVVVEAVPVFLEKLQAIHCMDVAEQSLQALEMLSKKHNKAILHANGVLACLTYVDFFSIAAQRAALTITANCCQNMTPDEFHYVQSSLPMLSARLTQQDKKSLESVCLCMARLVDNYQSDERVLVEIASHGLLTNIQQLLMITPPLFSTGMFVTVIRMLVLMCANCPDLAVQLLKQNIAETLCFLLVGPSDQGASQTIELVSRTPQELYEIVCLIGELLPKLPRDGLFAVDVLLRKNAAQSVDAVSWQWLDDHGLWHPYSLIDSRIIEAAHQSGEHEVSLTIYGGNYTIDFDSMQQINDDTGTARHVQRKVNSLAAAAAASVPRSILVKSDSREDILHEDAGLAATFIKTLFCVLYEVYSSSAGPSVRHKCLQAIMRMIYYGSPELLKYVLPSCNVSSHLAAMMASNDLKVVVAGIQMANILMEKLPDVFNVYFCREGVMHQIKRLCESEVIDLSTKKESLSDGAAVGTASSGGGGGGSSSSLLPGSSKDAVVSSPKKLDSVPTISTEGDKPSSPSPRLRLSSVLKHKKPPKRGTMGAGVGGGGSGTSRKSSKNEVGLEMHGLMGESSGTGTDLVLPPTRGKWNGPPKGSFLAGLHPSRWGRSSSMGPDRPYPALPAQVGLSQILHPDAVVRPPALPPRPHMVDNRDKIKQWITDQAMKFSEKYYGVESSRASNHPALSTLNLLCSATAALNNQDQEIESLQEIAGIITDSDMSPFEIIHSGLVGTLLTYLTAGDIALRDQHIRRFLLVMLGCKATLDGMADIDVFQPESFSSLIAKLMTCFHHLEQVKVHDLPGGTAASGRGNNALRFFDSHQLKCNLQRHTSCTNLKQWRGGTVKIDPLALVQAIERYLIMRGYGRVRPNADNDCSDDDDASDDDIDDTLAVVSLSHGSGRHRIEFLINDHVLPYNMTVYEAVKQFSNVTERENNETDTDSDYLYGSTGIWINTHTIWYRPAADPDGTGETASSPKKTKSDKSRGRHTSKSNREGDFPVRVSPLEEFLTPALPPSVTVKDPSLQVLALLRLLHALNRYWGTLFEKSNAQMLISGQDFISNKLTAKANRQLQDPLVIMTGNMPQWLIQIGRTCPFLLPFDTRLSLFYATTFDRERAMHRLQDVAHEAGQADSTERVAPRLERRKSAVSRDDLLKQAEKVLNDLGSSKAILEIQYENEVGTGLGPTLEFYTLVSKELQRMDLELWRGDPVSMKDQKGSDEGVMYLYSACGLFPSPIARTAKATYVNKIKSKFRFLGKFMAKALMDSRMLDLPLSRAFFKWMLGHEQSLGPDDLHHVDPAVARTFVKLQEILQQKKRIDGDKSHTAESRRLALESLTLDGCSVEDLDLDFILPGFPNIELKKGGKDIPLTLDNLEDYLKFVSHWSLVEGTRRQFESFREGFESMFSLSSLTLFYPEEMDQLFCGNFYEPWTVKYLMESCRPDHGYNQDSQAIKFLYEILSSYNAEEQRMFIQFMTGSPRLPIGDERVLKVTGKPTQLVIKLSVEGLVLGLQDLISEARLKSLTPLLTIVRKTAETNENPDDSLPSVMTCVNYLKLPDYSSLEIMRGRLSLAAREGQLSFHLS